jgi:hypothetical protein
MVGRLDSEGVKIAVEGLITGAPTISSCGGFLYTDDDQGTAQLSNHYTHSIALLEVIEKR